MLAATPADFKAAAENAMLAAGGGLPAVTSSASSYKSPPQSYQPWSQPPVSKSQQPDFHPVASTEHVPADPYAQAPNSSSDLTTKPGVTTYDSNSVPKSSSTNKMGTDVSSPSQHRKLTADAVSAELMQMQKKFAELQSKHGELEKAFLEKKTSIMLDRTTSSQNLQPVQSIWNTEELKKKWFIDRMESLVSSNIRDVGLEPAENSDFLDLEPLFRKTFMNFDTDNNGNISVQEFQLFVVAYCSAYIYNDSSPNIALNKAANFILEDQVSHDNSSGEGARCAKALWNAMDIDQSGTLDYVEFWAYFSHPARMPRGTNEEYTTLKMFVEYWANRQLLVGDDGFSVSARQMSREELAAKDKTISDKNDADSAQASERDKLLLRRKVCQEILSTENTYVKSLEGSLVYLKLCQQHNIFNSEEELIVFGNIPLILQLNLKFRDLLKHILDNEDQMLAQLFIDYAPEFKTVYMNFFINYKKSIDLLSSSRFKSKEFQETLKDEKVNLQTLLITPIQRIPRYLLLLKELDKRTNNDHPDKLLIQEAILKIDDTATQINKAMKDDEDRIKIHELEMQFEGTPSFWKVDRMFPTMEVSVSATYNEGALLSCQLFLFNDMLAIAVPLPLSAAYRYRLVCKLPLDSGVKLEREHSTLKLRHTKYVAPTSYLNGQPCWAVWAGDGLFYLAGIVKACSHGRYEIKYIEFPDEPNAVVSVDQLVKYQTVGGSMSSPPELSDPTSLQRDLKDIVLEVEVSDVAEAGRLFSCIRQILDESTSKICWTGCTTMDITKDYYDIMEDKEVGMMEARKSSTVCDICNKPFSLTFRRHYCKQCNKCVCKQCSPGKKVLKGMRLSGRPVRICSSCENASKKVP